MHDEMEDRQKGATGVATTMVTVLFTVFGLGGSTKMLLDRLGVDQGVPPYEEDPAMLRAGACEALFVDACSCMPPPRPLARALTATSRRRC